MMNEVCSYIGYIVWQENCCVSAAYIPYDAKKGKGFAKKAITALLCKSVLHNDSK